jgi:hypothetical protein
MVRFVREFVAGLLVLGLGGGCVHGSDGVRERIGDARFDAKSVTTPTESYHLLSDGSWAGTHGDRYMVQEGALQAVAPFATSGPIVGGQTRVWIDREGDGVRFIPTSSRATNWTFVTEDGKAIPRDLEVPLYIAAQLGLGGLWVTYHDPDYLDAVWHLGTDCSVVVFDLQGRRVAGWFERQGGNPCPAPRFPDAQVLARLAQRRNERWASPLRPPAD